MFQVYPLVIARILSVQSIYLLSIYLGSNWNWFDALEGGWDSSILLHSQVWPERCPSCNSLCNIWTEEVPDQFKNVEKKQQQKNRWFWLPENSLGPCSLLYKVFHRASHYIACCLRDLSIWINPSMPLCIWQRVPTSLNILCVLCPMSLSIPNK